MFITWDDWTHRLIFVQVSWNHQADVCFAPPDFGRCTYFCMMLQLPVYISQMIHMMLITYHNYVFSSPVLSSVPAVFCGCLAMPRQFCGEQRQESGWRLSPAAVASDGVCQVPCRFSICLICSMAEWQSFSNIAVCAGVSCIICHMACPKLCWDLQLPVRGCLHQCRHPSVGKVQRWTCVSVYHFAHTHTSRYHPFVVLVSSWPRTYCRFHASHLHCDAKRHIQSAEGCEKTHTQTPTLRHQTSYLPS